MKRIYLLLLFVIFSKSLYSQNIEDSIRNLYKPNNASIIKNKIESIEYVGKQYKTIEKYNWRTGNLIELIRFAEASLCAPGIGRRDSLMPIEKEEYYYSGIKRDSIVSMKFERSRSHSYKVDTTISITRYDSSGKIIYDYVDLRYKGKIKYYTVDSIKMKMKIKVYPELDTSKIFCWLDIHTKPDTTIYFYDNKNRLEKIIDQSTKTTFTYKSNLIVVEESRGDHFSRTEYLFKKNKLIKESYYITDNIKSIKPELYYSDEYTYKNNLISQILSKNYSYNYDSIVKVIMVKGNKVVKIKPI